MTACVLAGMVGGEMSGESLLITRAQQGDLQAFNQLVLSYQGLAYNVAYGILGDSDSATDATQDGFLKAYRAIHRYWGGSFKAWLMRILTNTCYDQLRWRKRQQQRVRSLDALGEGDDGPAIRDRRAGPEEWAEGQELRRVIQQGLGTLPADQRTVVLLYDLEGFSYEEIAQTTGMPLGTVKSRLSRARSRLRDYLRAQGAWETARTRLTN